MSNTKFIKNLTPERAWNEYVTFSVEQFYSSSLTEGVADITKMCKLYAKCIPKIMPHLYTDSQLEHIANLLEQYVNEYLDKIGGIEQLTILTDEELNELEDKVIDEILYFLSKK